MQIKGADGYSPEMIRDEIERGGRLVIYLYCVSIVFMTFKRPTDIHFIRAGQSPVARGLPFTFVTLLFGWWGFPWGPIYSIESLFKNLRGGVDVTDEVLASILPREPASYSSAAIASSASGNAHTPPARPPLPPRKPSFIVTPRLVAICVAAVAALGFAVFATSSYHASQNLQVAVLNGLPVRTSVRINDENVVIAPFGYQLVKVPEGDIRVGAVAGNPATTLHIEGDFWSRVFNPQIAIINPDRVALIERYNVVYQSKNAKTDLSHLVEWKLLANESHYLLPEPDYLFVEAPENHSISSGQKFLKQTRIGNVSIDKIDQRLGLVKDNRGEESAKAYANGLAAALPDSLSVPGALHLHLDPKDALAVIEPRLADKPLRVEWHRAYQSLVENVFPEIDLQTRYAELVAQNPGDGTALYLLARIEADTDKARQEHTQALSAAKPCAYAHIGLGYLDSTSARFQDALDHYDAALGAGLTNETVRKGRRDMLLALNRHDELIKDIAARRASDPSDLSLMVEEIQAAAISPATTPVALDALMKRCVARCERESTDEQKPLVRPYLDAKLAYALGDEARFIRSADQIKGTRSSFEAAISRRDHAAARLAVKEAPELPLAYLLELHLVAAQQRDTAAADLYWTDALKALGREGKRGQRVAEQLSSGAPLDLEALRKIDLSSDDKALLFAGLGLKNPTHRSTLFAWANQHNYAPAFPRLLITSVTRPTPETTSL